MTKTLSGQMPTKRRYLALFFPFLPAERWLRTAPRRPDAPLVFAEKQRGAMRLASVDAAALAVGLSPGMPLADARAQIGELAVVPHDPVLDHGWLDRLAQGCARYTPLVALDSPDGLILDITGCCHLFDGEAGLIHDLDRRRLDARVERAGRITEQAAQRGRGVGAKARRDIRHRAARKVADRLQSCADERGRRLGFEFERGDGQAADRLSFVGGGARLVARERARGVGGGAERVAQGQAEAHEAVLDIGDQSGLAAEQVDRACNVEDQPVGGVERNERRVTRAALCEPVEPVLIERRVVGNNGQFADLRARIGE